MPGAGAGALGSAARRLPPPSGSPATPHPSPGPLLCVSFGRGAEVTAAAAGGGREGLWGMRGAACTILVRRGGSHAPAPDTQAFGEAGERRDAVSLFWKPETERMLLSQPENICGGGA